jgi:Cell Wall Hydrolase
MRHGLRAGGLAAPLLALAASTASATPSVAPGVNALRAAQLTVLVSANLPGNAVGGPAAQASETHIRSTFDAPAATKVASPISSGQVTPLLHKLVRTYEGDDAPDAEQKCLAGAVYFEARGEPLEGQLAVAEVILNRAASGEYPASICEVVTQPAQFSFVHNGLVPPIDESSVAWRTALAVAHIADDKLVNELAPNVLWYHADYVAPTWDRHVAPVVQIGAHIFYRRA